MKEKLIPLSTIITPNLPEAYQLIAPRENREELSRELLGLGAQAVLLKGGHASGEEANDFFIDHTGYHEWLHTKRIESKNTHGTGCTLSSAICAYLARGLSLRDACAQAKNYLFQAILHAKDNAIGKGCGPVEHFY